MTVRSEFVLELSLVEEVLVELRVFTDVFNDLCKWEIRSKKIV
jgi:hypothetical protein